MTADHTPERLSAEAMSIGALREAIINATELDGAFGQNVHESKAVMLRVGDKCYPLAEVSVGFYADTGRFVMFLTAPAAHLADVEALLGRVLSEKRVRHDHAYPMEVGPHHCAGCDLERDIRAALHPDPSARP